MSAPLLHFDEIPSFQRKNPYIRQGYRSMLSHHLCLRSLFWWTNETLNIWTHVSGFGILILVLLYDLVFNFSRLDIDNYDLIIIVLTLAAFEFCLISSAAYHTFCCHSEDAYNNWLFLDIFGVSLSLTFIFISGIHFAFNCHSSWYAFYISSVFVLFVAVFVMMIHPYYKHDKYFSIRLTLLICWSLYGIVPILHWIYLMGGITAFVVRIMVPRLIGMYLIAGLGIFVYITKYPEKLWPGKVDYIGSSHQWWHILVVMAFYWWYNTGLKFIQLRHFNKC